MMVHQKPSLAVILCGGVLWLQLVSASRMNVFKGKVIPDDKLTSSMAANSSCMCYKQCLVQPTCNGATYKYNSSDFPLGSAVGDTMAKLEGKPLWCFFSTHYLNETDLQRPIAELFSVKVTSFLQQVERTTKNPDDGVTDESSTTTTEVTTTVTPTTTEATTTTTTTEKAPECNDHVIEDNCFHFSVNKVSWSEAERECQNLCAQLASLPSEKLFNAVRKYLSEKFSSSEGWWVHLKKHSSGWEWQNGTRLSTPDSKFWAPNKPDDRSEEMYARMQEIAKFFLNDAEDSRLYNYICIF